MANIKFAENVRNQINDAVQKGAKALIDTKEVFPKDKVSKFARPICILIFSAHSVYRRAVDLYLLKFWLM